MSTPEERLREAGRKLASLRRAEAREQAKRDEAVAELRAEGWGLDRLAQAAGVSKTAMKNLVRRLES